MDSFEGRFNTFTLRDFPQPGNNKNRRSSFRRTLPRSAADLRALLPEESELYQNAPNRYGFGQSIGDR